NDDGRLERAGLEDGLGRRFLKHGIGNLGGSGGPRECEYACARGSAEEIASGEFHEACTLPHRLRHWKKFATPSVVSQAPSGYPISRGNLQHGRPSPRVFRFA